MSQQSNGFLLSDFIPGTAQYNTAESQINPSIVPQQFAPYRSVPCTPDLLKRSALRLTVPRQVLPHQSSQGVVSQPPQIWSGQPSQYRSTSGGGRSNQYPSHQFQHQYSPRTFDPGLGSSRPVRSQDIIEFHSQHIRPNQPPSLDLSNTRMSQQISPPPCVPRQASPRVPPQRGPNRSVQGNRSQMPPQQYLQSPRPVQNSPSHLTTNQQDVNRQYGLPNFSRVVRIPQPSSTDWTTYRIDKQDTRLSKNIPPPQGTYKVSQGIGKTDYSDPRDFFAPTEEEQVHVWRALQPTRDTFADLTKVVLKMNDMRCLSMGYNASWDEIKRKLVEWIFENFSPDRTADEVAKTDLLPSTEVSGYTTEGLRAKEIKQHNPKEINFFVSGELIVNAGGLLSKLERWYGLIEDFQYSPTWPYARQRNAGGYLVQNRDCFACMHCRMNQIFCHGFREHLDRKCAPCARQGLKCSNEE